MAQNARWRDVSGTITAGGVAQSLVIQDQARNGLIIQNQSTGDLWINDQGDAAASQPSFWIPAGSYWENPANNPPARAFSIFGATTGQAFAAREF